MTDNESEIGTEYNDFPVCPYCGEEHNDWWDGTNMESDGDTEIRECDKCGKKFKVYMWVEYTFDTEKIEETKEVKKL